jgi:hypothetical protein
MYRKKAALVIVRTGRDGMPCSHPLEQTPDAGLQARLYKSKKTRPRPGLLKSPGQGATMLDPYEETQEYSQEWLCQEGYSMR